MQNFKMAPELTKNNSSAGTDAPEISFMPLKLAIDIVPIFDGENIAVENFIKKCKIAVNSVKPSDRKYIKILIESKIKGNAHNLIQNTFSNFDDLLKTLRYCYSKILDLDEIENQLANMRQEENEKVAFLVHA